MLTLFSILHSKAFLQVVHGTKLKALLGGDAGEAKSIATLMAHADFVTALAAAKHVPLLASAGLRGQVFLWDLSTVKPTSANVRSPWHAERTRGPACVCLGAGHAHTSLAPVATWLQLLLVGF